MSTKLGTILADFTTQLATALIIGGTSATLQSATDDDSIALPSGRYFFALDGSNSNKEHISCDLVGTALTNIKSVSRQGVEATGVVRAHRVGCSVTLTDFAHIKYINDLVSGGTTFNASVPLGYDGAPSITTGNQFATKTYVDGVAVALTGDQTIAGIKTFSSSPIVPTPTTNFQAATKAYADGLAIAGSPDSQTGVKGIGRVSVAPVSPTVPIFVGDNDPRVIQDYDTMTSGEAISAGDWVSYDVVGGKVWKASAAALDKRINVIGVAKTAASGADQSFTVNVTRMIYGLTSRVNGTVYYLSDTQGAISTSAGTISRKVGIGVGTTAIRKYPPGYGVGVFIGSPISLSGVTLPTRMVLGMNSSISTVSFSVGGVTFEPGDSGKGPLLVNLEAGDVPSYNDISSVFIRLLEN